jgi:lipopolysaccharide transport system ATP-binding protein
MKPIVRVENLSKSYRIGALDPAHATFREAFAKAVVAPLKRLGRERTSVGEVLWALKAVNFEVKPGEIVGLIGRNGAGKSTLLKIISRITVPSTGFTEVYGRIGSLLEVGTGFHPDLTGRENVFLNGTILGIRRAEVARKFDEIIAFSELDRFVDTPVKWYSSGMYLRLAFSVAIHLNAEVLLMDEVLAVGDVSFQLKCLDKMNEIRNQGRTILFVSHSMAAVTRLCQRAILLDRGEMLDDGPAHKVVKEYLGSIWKVRSERKWSDLNEAPGNETVRLRQVRICDEKGRTTESVDIRQPVGIELVYEVLQSGSALVPKIDIHNEEGVHLFSAHDVGDDWRYVLRSAGRYVSTVWIPGNFFSEGNLLVSAALVSHTPATVLHAHAYNAVTFQVIDSQCRDSARGDYVGPISGVIRPLLGWSTALMSAKGEFINANR